MKKWTSLLFVVAVMLFLTANLASAQTLTPKLFLDGKELSPAEPPAVVGGYTMVPVRIVGENLGYEVGYDSGSKKVTVKNGSSVIVMTVGKKSATLDGKAVTLQAPPTAKSGTTLIPLRFVGEAFGLQVYWDNSNKSVFLYSGKSSNGGNDSGSGGGGSGTGDGSGDGSGSGSGDGSGSPNGSGGSGNGSSGDGGLIGVVTPGEEAEGGGNGDGSAVPDPGAAPVQIRSVLFDGEDSVLIRYDGGVLLPATSVLTGPDRIVVDLPNADFAADFAPGLTTDGNSNVKPIGELAVTGHEALQKVRYSLYLDNPRTLRFVLDLSQKQEYTVTNDAAGGMLKIELKAPSATTPDKPAKGVYTVVLDAGHGGSDPGAQSVIGKWEKDFNLAVILKLQAILASDKRLNLVLTRSSDTYPTLADRYNLANSIGADLFLSVHGNSFPSKPTVNGSEVYYTRAESLDFAKVVHQYAVPSTGLADRGVLQKSLAVTRETKMPAVLYEAGYLSNATEATKMYTEDFQNKLAQGLATAILKYLKLS